MKILVVEDTPDYSLLLTKMLNKHGHNSVQTVASGRLALEAMAHEKFEIVICDYNMPEMTGHQLFEILKQGGIPCGFLLWTNAEAETLPLFEGIGFLGVVRKNEFSELLGTINKNLH